MGRDQKQTSTSYSYERVDLRGAFLGPGEWVFPQHHWALRTEGCCCDVFFPDCIDGFDFTEPNLHHLLGFL